MYSLRSATLICFINSKLLRIKFNARPKQHQAARSSVTYSSVYLMLPVNKYVPPDWQLRHVKTGHVATKSRELKSGSSRNDHTDMQVIWGSLVHIMAMYADIKGERCIMFRKASRMTSLCLELGDLSCPWQHKSARLWWCCCTTVIL